jgi:hypothetical protein
LTCLLGIVILFAEGTFSTDKPDIYCRSSIEYRQTCSSYAECYNYELLWTKFDAILNQFIGNWSSAMFPQHKRFITYCNPINTFEKFLRGREKHKICESHGKNVSIGNCARAYFVRLGNFTLVHSGLSRWNLCNSVVKGFLAYELAMPKFTGNSQPWPQDFVFVIEIYWVKSLIVCCSRWRKIIVAVMSVNMKDLFIIASSVTETKHSRTNVSIMHGNFGRVYCRG